jgi:hypothetical protein
MLKKKYLSVIPALLVFTTVVCGQSKVGTTAAPFLTIGVGSRAISMGGAFVSIANDATALHWNPAGLAWMEKSEVALVHTEWLAGMKFNFVGAAFDMGQIGTFGASATLLNAGEMEVTTEFEQEGTGIYFDSYDLAVTMSYGYLIYDKFSIGLTGKYIHQQIWHESATGMAVDLGILMITPLRDIRLGVVITNFGTDMRMEGEDLLTTIDPDPAKSGNNENVYANVRMERWPLPLTMRVGLSGEAFQSDQHRLTLALDWVHPNDNYESVNLGTEYAFRELVALRLGYKGLHPDVKTDPYRLILSPDDSGGGITFGGGLKVSLAYRMDIKVDYAFESYDRLGNIHKFSIGFAF